MPEAKPEHSEIRRESFRFDARTTLLLTIIVGFLVFAGIGEQLRPQEAKFLNQVIESPSESTTLAVVVQSNWADLCGLMVRPSRLLGLLSGSLGLLLLASLVSQRGGATLLSVAAAGAVGVVSSESCLIGGSAPFFFALTAALFAIQKVFRMPLRPLAFVAAILVVGAQIGLGLLSHGSDSIDVWFGIGPNLAFFGLPPWAGVGLIAAIIAGAIIFANEPDGLLLIGLMVVTVPLAQAFSIPVAPPSWVLAGYAVPICLWLGIPRPSKKWGSAVTTALVLTTCLVLATAFVARRGISDGRLERESLDWVAREIPQSGWLALDGEGKEVLRYFEYSGHRTGHRSILIRNEEDLKALIRVALSEKPPVIAMIGIDPDSVKALLARYVIRPQDGQPNDILVAHFHRRN